MDSMGFNDCLLFIQEFGTDCFCLVLVDVGLFSPVNLFLSLIKKKRDNKKGLFYQFCNFRKTRFGV